MSLLHPNLAAVNTGRNRIHNSALVGQGAFLCFPEHGSHFFSHFDLPLLSTSAQLQLHLAALCYCTSHPSCPCPPWLHIFSWHSQPFASGVFMNPAASQHLPYCSSSWQQVVLYETPPSLACTCFLPHHRPRWWSPVLHRLRPSSRGRSSHAGCTVSRQWSGSPCRKTQERAGREMGSAGERCQVPPGISRSLEVVTIQVLPVLESHSIPPLLLPPAALQLQKCQKKQLIC